MAGAESRRVDQLVNDVGTIKGDMHAVKGEVGRLGEGISKLNDSMVALNRHSLLLETQQTTNVEREREHVLLDGRVKAIELEMPALKEARSDYRRVMLGVLAMVGLALLALVIKT